MLSPRRSLRLRGAGRRLVLLLALLTSALAWPQTPAQVRAAVHTAAPPSAPAVGDLPTFIVTWSISANERYLSGPAGLIWSTSITGHAMAVATVESSTNFGVKVPTLSVLGEHEFDSWTSTMCFDTLRQWNTEPQRYAATSMRSPNPYAITVDRPSQKDDGTWVMDEPLDITERASKMMYTLRHVEDCSFPDYTYHAEWDTTGQLMIGDWLFTAMELVGDSSAKTFTGSKQYSVPDNTIGGQVQITRKVTVTRLGNCAGLPSPIDVSFPGAKNLLVALEANPASILPNAIGTMNEPDPALLKTKVTCDGVPVKNAEVRLKVTALANSGGHIHDAADHPRPRGYMREQGKKPWTELTEAAPTFKSKTGEDGIAKVEFRPGTDLAHRRGISGEYQVQAEVTNATGTPQQTVEVRRTDFVRVEAGDGYTMVGQTPTHPDNHWASAVTAARIPELAAEFRRIQEENNEERMSNGKPPWPVLPIGVNDISLERGGLFDVVGWLMGTNVYTGTPWSVPHLTHLEGTGVDINHFVDGSAAQNAWLAHELDDLGLHYGGWADEPNVHLNVNQGAPGQASRATAGAGLSDPAATTLWLASEKLTTAAPGQVVTYTLAANNTRGGAAAEGVVLSATLPAGLAPVDGDPAPTRVLDNQMAWDFGSLPAGAFPKVVTLSARLAYGLAAGTPLTVTGQVTSQGPDADLSNNRQDAATLWVQPALPDLLLDSDLGSQVLEPGKTMTFTLGVANYGTVAAPGSTLGLTLPPSVTLQSATPPPASTAGGSLTWALGTLAREQAAGAQVRVSVDPLLVQDLVLPGTGEAPHTLPFMLNASSALADANPSNNSLQVDLPLRRAGPDLWLSLALAGGGDPGEVIPDSDVVLRLLYGNAGNRPIASTVISLTLPAELNPLSAEPPAAHTVPGADGAGTTLGWTTGRVAPGDTGRITVNVHVESAPAAPTVLVAAITARDQDLNPFDNVVLNWLAGGTPAASRRLYLPLLCRGS